MFERFTESARAVVVDAQSQARALHHPEVRAEHLLLAILDHSVAGLLGIDRDAVVQRMAAEADDDAALRAIGIDLSVVRAEAEQAFGPGALDQPRPRRYGLRRRVAWTGNHLPFTSAAQDALAQALRETVALKQNAITERHILLGLIASDQTPVARLLSNLGTEPRHVRSTVSAQLRRAA